MPSDTAGSIINFFETLLRRIDRREREKVQIDLINLLVELENTYHNSEQIRVCLEVVESQERFIDLLQSVITDQQICLRRVGSLLEELFPVVDLYLTDDQSRSIHELKSTLSPKSEYLMELEAAVYSLMPHKSVDANLYEQNFFGFLAEVIPTIRTLIRENVDNLALNQKYYRVFGGRSPF